MASSSSGGSELDLDLDVIKIDINELPLPQLKQLSQHLEEEIEFLISSQNELEVEKTVFLDLEECVHRSDTDSKGKTILLPLTDSMYIAGQMSDTDNLLVDIGAGYYMDMIPGKARDYFRHKTVVISGQMEKIEPLLLEKYVMKQVVVDKIKDKIKQQKARPADL